MEKVRIKALLAKIEAVYKTDAMPDPATDGVQVEDHFWTQLQYGFLEENLREGLAVSGLGRAGQTQPEGRFGRLTASFALKGTSAAFAAGVKPELDVILRMCGHSATLDATSGSETWTYRPRSTGFESATVYAYSSGSLFKLVGCRGRIVRLTALPGQIGRVEVEIFGVIVDDPTDVAVPAITYPQAAVVPPTVKAAGLTLNAFDPADFSSFTLEQRGELVEMPRGNDPHGHAGYELTDWDPHIIAVIDAPPKSAFDPYALRKSGALFPWDIGPIGAVQYNRWTLSGPAGRVADVPHSDDRGFAMIDLTIEARNSAPGADDAYSLIFS